MQSVANSLSNGINAIKERCSDEDERSRDWCDKRQQQEENRCYELLGTWMYSGCMDRARIRGDLCRRGIPDEPREWGDADVDGWAPPPAPRGKK